MQSATNIRMFNSNNMQLIQAGIVDSPKMMSDGIKAAFRQISSLLRKAESLHICDNIVRKIDNFESDVIDKVPHVFDYVTYSPEVDDVLRLIHSKLEPFKLFNDWLDTNELNDIWNDTLYVLAEFLVKLPLRVIRNIVGMVANIIGAALYATVHPLKATTKLAKLIVRLVEELTKPVTWTKIGSGLIAASLANMAIGNPASIVGFIVGGAMMAGGISIGALLAALKEETGRDALNAAALEVWTHVQRIPEAMLTSFCLGLIAGGIQRGANLIASTEKSGTIKYMRWRGDEYRIDSWNIDLIRNEVTVRWQSYYAYFDCWTKITSHYAYLPESILPSLLTSSISNVVSEPIARF